MKAKGGVRLGEVMKEILIKGLNYKIKEDKAVEKLKKRRCRLI